MENHCQVFEHLYSPEECCDLCTAGETFRDKYVRTVGEIKQLTTALRRGIEAQDVADRIRMLEVLLEKAESINDTSANIKNLLENPYQIMLKSGRLADVKANIVEAYDPKVEKNRQLKLSKILIGAGMTADEASIFVEHYSKVDEDPLVTEHVASGMEIIDVYAKGKYGGSCISNNPGGVLFFYAANPESVKLYYRMRQGEIVTKALLWKVYPNGWYMDRIYNGGQSKSPRATIEALARREQNLVLDGKEFKMINLATNDSAGSVPLLDRRGYVDCSIVKTKEFPFTGFPYLDTMRVIDFTEETVRLSPGAPETHGYGSSNGKIYFERRNLKQSTVEFNRYGEETFQPLAVHTKAVSTKEKKEAVRE